MSERFRHSQLGTFIGKLRAVVGLNLDTLPRTVNGSLPFAFSAIKCLKLAACRPMDGVGRRIHPLDSQLPFTTVRFASVKSALLLRHRLARFVALRIPRDAASSPGSFILPTELYWSPYAGNGSLLL
jgi:hypothetical protein